jgi:GNAT superfamily N-acetyltransferase
VDDDPRSSQLPRGVALRDVRPGDAHALVHFHHVLSSEGARTMSATSSGRWSVEALVHLATVDRPNGEAIVGVHGHDIVALGTCDPIDERDAAEVAVVVAEPWVEHGVDAVLFRRLVTRARDRGRTRLEVVVRPEQQRLLAVFQRTGVALPRPGEDGLVHVRLSLVPPAPTVAPDRPGAVMRWQRTSVRYITRYRSTDAKYTIESVAGATGRWHLRRQRVGGSDLVGVFVSTREASVAAEADAALGRRRRPDGRGSGRGQPRP